MPEDIERIIEKLKESGFVPVNNMPAEMPDAVPEPEDDNDPDQTAAEAAEGEISPDTADETDEADSGSDNTRLTVTLPRSVLPDDALGRLKMIVVNKEVLFKRALLVDALPIDVSETEVSFPWFTLTGTDGEAEAYTQFVTALCKMAREQTRILDKPYDGDNDRFAMRIFMVRLGMKGGEFDLARKLMMKRLTGNSGWRYGTPPKKPNTIVTSDDSGPSAETISEE